MVELVFIVISRQGAEDQRYRRHVLKTVIPVSRISQIPFFGNDADSGFMGRNHDFLNFVQPPFDHRVQSDSCLRGRLCMEFRRKRYFEQDVLHHIASEGLRQAELALLFWL